ncbi:MAG: NERD domain-containing protein [Clostridia bacterium]|nr:NERD domain-containing protein [Clostridia bacterium]
MIYLFLLPILILCLIFLFYYISFRNSSYYKVTHNSFLSVWNDKGRLGEYLIYNYLRSLEKNGARFLFNIYLPKTCEETTEIDVLLIHKYGVFVFESKNYSGWIFGSETQKNWTQCLPMGKGRSSQKEHFLNPIFQNKLHISALKQVIGETVPVYSIIVFSERCTLKNISVSDPTVRVINRNQLYDAIRFLSLDNAAELSQADIDSVYNSLFPFTQVTDEVKENHVRAIQSQLPGNRPDVSSSEGASLPTPETTDKEDTVEEPTDNNSICPKCGGKLVLRITSRGKNKGTRFYGCSNYPKCHYIQNI